MWKVNRRRTPNDGKSLHGLLASFAASANKFYINRQCTFIVFILQCLQVQKQLANCLNIAETIVFLKVFNDVLYHVCT